MRLFNRISNSHFATQNYEKKDNISFKHRLILDIGASDPRGSVKILAQTDDGKDLFEQRGSFLNDNINGFSSSENFIDQLSKVITNASKRAVSVIKEKGLDKEEKKLNSLALFLPGPIMDEEAIIIANLKTTDGKSLTNVDLSKLPNKLKENNKNIEVADNLKFIPTKDLGGTGIGIAQILANHPKYKDEFKEGFYAVGVMTGGGFGSVNIQVLDEKYMQIQTSESSHNLAMDIKKKSFTRLGKLGASTKGIIENYAKSMDIKEETAINALIKTGNARIATENRIELDNKKDKDAINVLKKSKYYNVADQDKNSTTFQINKYGAKVFKIARTNAIGEYVDTVAQHAIQKINEGANLLVLTGPLALGLNKTVVSNREDFGKDNLRELIFDRIDHYIKDDLTCQQLRKAHNFDLVCDDSVKLADNTAGGAALLDDKTRTITRRGEWIIIPIDALKEKPKS
ncbi:MAG: hypothetical protein PHC34_01940 [Candidatus Gastranaerophilales bacterium]|nr:hypothetical protein [Candidatus Gastranaerophilales bacterium]